MTPPDASDRASAPRVEGCMTNLARRSPALARALILGATALGGLAAGVGGAAVALGPFAAAPAVAQPRDHRQPDRVRAGDRFSADDEVDMPAPPFRVHEWGVWRVRNGTVEHLADLARENPSFVHRASGAAPLPVTPRRHPELVAADKPVVFLWADVPLDVEITVEFAGRGQPWFYYPQATAGQTDPPVARTVRWQGHVTPPRATPTPVLARVSQAHFWSALRRAGASAFTPTGSTETERFLFYDGPTQFAPAVSVQRAGTATQPRFSMRALRPDPQGQPVWVVHGPSFERLDRQGAARRGDLRALRTELRAALVARGLRETEADALLDTWRGDLFTRAETRAISFVSRADYDAMLPITVTPMPIELVRVGLVIDVL